MKTTVTLPVAIPYQSLLYAPDAFVVKEKAAGGRMVWLQRIAHRILAKYGYRPMNTQNVIKTETIEVDGVIAALGAMLERACEITGEIDFVAVVGAKEWGAIRQRGDLEMLAPYSQYDLPVPERLMRRAPQYRLREMDGLVIAVVSWQSGIVLLPRSLLRAL